MDELTVCHRRGSEVFRLDLGPQFPERVWVLLFDDCCLARRLGSDLRELVCFRDEDAALMYACRHDLNGAEAVESCLDCARGLAKSGKQTIHRVTLYEDDEPVATHWVA